MRYVRSLLALSLLATCGYALVPFLRGWATVWVGIPIVWVMAVVMPGLALSQIARRLGDDAIESTTRVFLNGLVFQLALCFGWAVTGVSLDAFRAAMPVMVVALCAAVPLRDRTRIEVIRPRLRN
jgi:predicted MFS family arabinose efflux permease